MSQRKYVLITGVSSGIGYESVGYLIERGFHVLGSVRKDADLVRLNKAFPEHFTGLQFDVTQKDQVLTAYDKAAALVGKDGLAGIVNNAGMVQGGPIELIEEDKFRYQMEVNLFAVRTVTNIFLPLLKGDREKNIPGGKIIMISSISGVFNTPFNGAYCISKHALESLAEVYRRELMMYNIDVVSIQPGPIQSDIWKKNIGKYSEYEGTDYEKLLHSTNRVMDKAQKDALPASVISKLIHKILTKKTKLAFIVNTDWIVTVILIKYLPARWVDKIFYKKLFT